MVKTWAKRLIIGAFSLLIAANPLMTTADVAALTSYSLDRNGKQVSLDWADTENATDYSVVKIINNTELEPVIVETSDYTDSDTLPNHDYKYRVTARIVTLPVEDNADPVEPTEPGEGEGEGTEDETTGPTEPIETYEELFTTSTVRYGLGKLTASSKLATYNSVTVSYNSIYGVSEYEIYRSTKKTSGFKKIAVTNKTLYTNKSLALNTTYYYKVRGKQTTTKGTYYTNWSTVLARKTVLGKTTLKVSKKTYNSVKLSWAKADGATKYKIYRSTKKTSGFKTIKTVTSTTYTEKKLKTGTTYYYKLVPYRGSTKGATTKVVSAKLTLGKTTKVTSSSTLTSVKVNWKKVAGASGYSVYRAASKNGTYKRIATVKGNSKTTYTNKGLKSNKNYYYIVKAYRNVSGKKVYGGNSEKERQRTPMSQGLWKFNTATIVVLEGPKGQYVDWDICILKAKCGTDPSYSVESDLFMGRAYVYVPAGYYLNFGTSYGKKAVMRNLADRFDDDFSYNKKSFSAPGEYWVGLDIAPGTYRIFAPVSNAVYKCGLPSCLNFPYNSGDDIEILSAGEYIDWVLEEGMFIVVSRDPGVIAKRL